MAIHVYNKQHKKEISSISQLLTCKQNIQKQDSAEENRVFLLDNIDSRQKLYQIYQGAELFCLLSQNKGHDVEGFGIVFLEASSFGTLCIGTRSGGIPEAIRDGITGFIVEEHDVKKIAEIIDDLLKNPDKQRQLSAQAKQYAQETLSWDNEEKKLFQCLP